MKFDGDPIESVKTLHWHLTSHWIFSILTLLCSLWNHKLWINILWILDKYIFTILGNNWNVSGIFIGQIAQIRTQMDSILGSTSLICAYDIQKCIYGCIQNRYVISKVISSSQLAWKISNSSLLHFECAHLSNIIFFFDVWRI